MSPNTPDTEPAPVPVATGDRREEVHFEPDPGQLVVAKHLVKPDAPLPLDVTSERDDDVAATETDVPPVEDVLVAPETPSVWDARPLAEDSDISTPR
ncbi:MAG TPA: hypothetical protein VJS38_01060 [Phenylobacterium sp.]|uniref:hypothetical protein n=1 Tax=Phenylobacterium sp. TaxID=1871053 RepID=UPI002B45EA12|nr:hypothetical protein [Phenylobacterium sp.]HKR86741.1 hypothetical protein [Phenylobacterium sp.]